MVRTDTGVGDGNYNGLPMPFTAYRGATIIVDDHAVIAALRLQPTVGATHDVAGLPR